jgi:hypothetical protein
MVVWEKPVSAAIERIDQCVASAGVVRNVARSRQQPGRRLSFEVGRGEPRQADHRSDPAKIDGATWQPYVRDGQVRQPLPCRLRIAESPGTVQTANGQHGDDELVSPNMPVPPRSAPSARSAGLAYLHSR